MIELICEKNYGSDADGNRGMSAWLVDSVTSDISGVDITDDAYYYDDKLCSREELIELLKKDGYEDEDIEPDDYVADIDYLAEKQAEKYENESDCDDWDDYPYE